MKRLLTLILVAIAFAGFGQNSDLALGSKRIANQMSPRKTIDPASHAVHNLAHRTAARSQNLKFYIDYGELDNQYAQNVTLGNYYPDDAIYPLNRNLPVDSSFTLRWALQWYPKIVDMVNSPTWPFVTYPPSKIQMNIDTVFVTLGHIHNSNVNDTVVISVWDFDALTSLSFKDSGCSGTLYGRIVKPVDTTLTGPGSQAGSVLIGTFPFIPSTPISIPQGKRFIIQVDFYGPAADEFYLVASRRDDCGNATCGSSLPYVGYTYNQSIAGVNSLGAIRYYESSGSANNGTYPTTIFYQDCNQSGSGPDSAACEYYPMEDLDIYPSISAVIPNFYADITADVASGCPNSTVNLTANAAGSSSSTFTYNWSASSGNLSSTSAQTVGLTLGSTSATVYVTVTDGNSQTALDTFVVSSYGININITQGANVTVNCGDSTHILTQISGTQTGPTYSWNTGATTSGVWAKYPGTYTVTVHNNKGCSATASTNVQYPNGVNNTVNFTVPSVVCQGHQTTFTNTSTGKGGSWNATWNMGNGDQVYTTDATYTFNTQGLYSVTLTMDSNGCTFVSPAHSVSVLSLSNATCVNGIDEVSFENAISLFPNPTNGNVNIAINGVEKNISIRVFNVLGSEVKNFTASDVPSSFNKNFDFSDLSNGTYLVKIQSADKTAIKRLSINR